jgi:thiol-disulfide isomerase/thioredoxin
MSSPKLLNFKVLKTDGGAHHGFEAHNVLTKDFETAYCSKRNRNVNMLLKYNGNICTITNYVVSCSSIDYTAPVKSGLVFFSESAITISDTNKYNNFTLEQFKALDRNTTDLIPDAFFDTQDGYFFSWHDCVFPAKKARFVLFKLIDAFAASNIDVGFIGLVGFDGEPEVTQRYTHICRQLDLVPEEPSKFQKLDHENNEIFGSPMTSLLIYNNDNVELGEELKVVLEEYVTNENSGVLFWCDEENMVYEETKMYYGITADIDILFLGKDDLQYLYSHTTEEPLNCERAINFFEGAIAGTLTRYLKSEPIPEVPTVNGLTTLVGDSVADYFANSDEKKVIFVTHKFLGLDQFLYEYSAFAKYLESNQIQFGVIDTDANDVDTSIVREVPSIYVINPISSEKNIDHFEGELVIEDFLDFIANHVEFDRADFLTKIEDIIVQLKKFYLKNVIEIESDEHFQEQTEKDGLIVVFWTAIWAPPCIQISPIYSTISEEFEATFLSVDIDEFEELSDEHEVGQFPTFHFIKNGDLLDTLEGADEPMLRQKLTELTTK